MAVHKKRLKLKLINYLELYRKKTQNSTGHGLVIVRRRRVRDGDVVEIFSHQTAVYLL